MSFQSILGVSLSMRPVVRLVENMSTFFLSNGSNVKGRALSTNINSVFALWALISENVLLKTPQNVQC